MIPIRDLVAAIVAQAREIRLEALRDALRAVMRAHGPIGDEPTYCAKALREMIAAEEAELVARHPVTDPEIGG